MTVIIFLIVLAVLIFVHELGHFLTARMFGIRVDEFALGFGPKVIGFKRGETVYNINLIPFGGFVKIFGENPNEESLNGPDSSRSFINKPRWQQAVVLVAGVTFNFIFGWLLVAIALSSGVLASTQDYAKYANRIQDPSIVVTAVNPGSPAEEAGIKAGDRIVGITTKTFVPPSNTGEITVSSVQEIITSSNGAPIVLSIKRPSVSDTVTIELTAESGIIDNKLAIGVGMDEVGEIRLPFYISIWEGLKFTWYLISATVVGVWDLIVGMFQGTSSLNTVTGPVGIAGLVGDAARLGFTYLLMFTALISINLGVLNLVPFPALDGGRLVVVLIESVVRRRVKPTLVNIVNTVGFALLMLLIVVVTYRDIVKLVK
jgi:regulator of sigma E protease